MTGELRKSIEASEPGTKSVSAGTPLFWAAFHSSGTSRLPKRPFAEPALEQALKRIPDFFVQELERARDR